MNKVKTYSIFSLLQIPDDEFILLNSTDADEESLELEFMRSQFRLKVRWEGRGF